MNEANELAYMLFWFANKSGLGIAAYANCAAYCDFCKNNKLNIHGHQNKQKYVIPAGFKFDGASIPKFLHMFLSPVGVLLMGGLVHDYAYKYETLLCKNKKDTMGVISQKEADQIFRDIGIEINGFYLMNYLAYWSLRLGGFMAWNKHRKVNAKIK